jgi:hypothetical protein
MTRPGSGRIFVRDPAARESNLRGDGIGFDLGGQ